MGTIASSARSVGAGALDGCCARWKTAAPTARSASAAPHLEFVHKVIGADRIIWSVDYPYLALDGTRAFIEKLPVSDEDREKMTHLNA
ncbi:amidohydrolase family protein [Catenulispora pinisilvae]|uniref:amidohydrolase family protein n=1 Tax=Catenulispora pinisilvae TaxID=2705253 RepID=UPI00189203FB|nr:amidohydrolase family protein [Catenulispora pinisilvae]